MLKIQGQRLDLGAIGKGYAADRCIEIYRAHGIRHAVLDLAGNIALLGRRPDGHLWRVGIQDPRQPRGECIGYLEAEDCSIVTSGTYAQHLDIAGHRYSHIIDPRSGYPVATEAVSATVVAASSCFADAIATACIVLGIERARALLSELQAEALLIDEQGQIHFTPGVTERFVARDARSRAT